MLSEKIKWNRDTIRNKMFQKSNAYNQFIVIKLNTSINDLNIFFEGLDVSFLELNRLISLELLEIPEKLRPIMVQRRVKELIMNDESSAIVIDRFDVLFEPSLKVKPIELFKEMSKNKMLIIVWRELLIDNKLIHAKSRHPEYQEQLITEDEIIKI